MGAIQHGSVIGGKYQVEALLARGGMGSVWSARHLSLDKRVAIKFIGPEVAGLEEARARFEREAKIAALLHSPHVVQIHDYGVDGDVPYLVMELLDGEDLSARLSRVGRLSLEDTGAIVAQVARALRRAASAGIVHRDLKPGNVFLVRSDDDEEIVKVLDFGIAKAPRVADDEATRAGAMIGSPRYMSPEQVRGSPLVDHRSDLWSLAVIAYRALTGKMPFHGTDMADLVARVCTERAVPPSCIDPALAPEIDAFFERAFARHPDDRFQTARELSLAFSAAVGDAPPASVSTPSIRVPAPLPPPPPSGFEAALRPAPLPVIDRPAPARSEPPGPAGGGERITSPEAGQKRRAAELDGSLLGVPRTIPSQMRAAPLGGSHGPGLHLLVGVGMALAALAGVLVGRTVAPVATPPPALAAPAAIVDAGSPDAFSPSR
jgi:serine/threonine-protein kinase